jgi:putative nucleotidyltransferase with HDIG domain
VIHPASVAHLARRFVGSFSTEPIDDAPARSALSPAEWSLWQGLSAADRRHALTVVRRLLDAHPEASRTEVAGALLHDIGKVEAPIGTFARVAATVVPVGDRARRYRDHERLGAALLRSVGSDPQVVAIVAGEPSEARSRVEKADAI